MSHTWPTDMFLAALTAILKRASRLVNMVSTLVSRLYIYGSQNGFNRFRLDGSLIYLFPA